MRHLILMRHAKTEQPAIGQSDISRELTERGRQDAPLVAKQLAKVGAQPTVALVSDAVRTRQTWDLIKPSFPDCQAKIMSSLYLAEAETIIREALQSDEEHVLVLGHNPGMHELACVIANGDTKPELELHEKLPTSGAVFFERENANSTWRLRSYIRARDLRE